MGCRAVVHRDGLLSSFSEFFKEAVMRMQAIQFSLFPEACGVRLALCEKNQKALSVYTPYIDKTKRRGFLCLEIAY